MVAKFYVDDELIFKVVDEPEFFRMIIATPEILEEHVEEFMDSTVEWLSTNPQKGILLDFGEVRYVSGAFALCLNQQYEDIKRRGIYVRFVNVDPAVQPLIDVSNITVVMSIIPDRPKISASEILEDLGKNMSDEELMRKHGLTERGLARLFGKLLRKGLIGRPGLPKKPEGFELNEGEEALELEGSNAKKTEVSAAEVLRDLSNKLTDLDLMQKYRLSRKGLNSLFSKLYRQGLISQKIYKQRFRDK
jgi:anti-anti-sigma regulatory factor